MAKTRAQKQKILEDLKEKIAKQKAIIFTDFTGVKVKDLSDLRKKLKLANCQLKVAKKTLMGIAFKEAKIEIEPRKLPGQVALVFGYQDPITPAKIVYQFSQANPNLKILAGFFENKFRELEEVVALAQLPPREELLAKLVGSLQASILNLVNVLQAPLEACLSVIRALGSK